MRTGSHAGWLRDRLAGTRILEVGGEEWASRGWRSRGARRVRRSARGVGVALALGCAVSGVVLSLASSEVRVTMTASAYRIDSAFLPAVAPGVYQGDGVMVVSSSDELRAGSAARVGGSMWRGVCVLSADGGAENCRWSDGSSVLTARDLWSQGSWQRTYSDGGRVEIAAARGVPVPFPVGR